jgi:hypothetical protein
MRTKTFKVTVRVEPNILADKYPNFQYNYDSAQEFVRRWVKRIEGDGFDKLTLGGWGYDIKVAEDYEAKNTLD